MSRDHLLGFPPVLLALDEPVRASQRTPSVRHLALTATQIRNHRELDAKLTRELGQTEVAKPAETLAENCPFKIGDYVLFHTTPDTPNPEYFGIVVGWEKSSFGPKMVVKAFWEYTDKKRGPIGNATNIPSVLKPWKNRHAPNA